MSERRMALQVTTSATKRQRWPSPAESLHRKPPLSGILASLSTPLNEIVERARALSMSWKATNDVMRSPRSSQSSGSLETLRSRLGELSATSRG